MITQNSRAVPFADPRPVDLALRDEILSRIAGLIEEGAYTGGCAVAEFEGAFAAFTATQHCVGVSSGLDALRLALLAGGVGTGDEVIVPATTFVATFEAVVQAGATPVPVDVSPDDYTLDVEAAEAAVTPRTRCILPVHLYGQMADMRAVRRLASRAGLVIIEDACQAHGARRDGLTAGACGTAGAFSFYPTKNLGAFGDAGAVVTDDAALADDVRALREHGQREKYRHAAIGYTARLDAVQAAVLTCKLERLDAWNAARAEAAGFYSQALADLPLISLPPVAAGAQHVWHLYVVRTPDSARLAAFLAERGIATGRHYPEPPHLTGAFAHLDYERGSFPITELLAVQVVSLPLFPGITEEQLESVAMAVRDYGKA